MINMARPIRNVVIKYLLIKFFENHYLRFIKVLLNYYTAYIRNRNRKLKEIDPVLNLIQYFVLLYKFIYAQRGLYWRHLIYKNRMGHLRPSPDQNKPQSWGRKKSIRFIKKEPFATERRIEIRPPSPFAADKLFIFILQKAKNLVLYISFPFFPFFIPFSFSSPSYFHIRFPVSAFSSQYTQNYPHVIPLIHGISHSYPPYPQPYARFPEACPMPCVNI